MYVYVFVFLLACVRLPPHIHILISQIQEVIDVLDTQLKAKDAERRVFKDKHGILTQEEREAVARQQKHGPAAIKQ